MLMRINRSNWGHLQKGALCPMLLYISSNRMGAFLLRDSAGSPTSTAPALLVTFVQNISIFRRNTPNSYLHHRIGPDRRLWRHPVSIEVPCSCGWCYPGRLPLSSTWFEHRFCHCCLVGLYSPWFDGIYLLFGTNTLYVWCLRVMSTSHQHGALL